MKSNDLPRQMVVHLGYLRHATFGPVIASRRQSLKLSRPALADLLRCSTTEIAEIEEGRMMPRLDQIYELADALDVDAADLFHEVRRVAEMLAADLHHVV